MPKDFSRTERVAEQIKEELACLIQRELSHVGMVTVVDVNVTRDFAYAKVYVTVFDGRQLDDNADVSKAIDALNDAAPFLRSLLAKRLHMRTVPELSFLFDSTLEEGNRLMKLIEKASASKVSDDE